VITEGSGLSPKEEKEKKKRRTHLRGGKKTNRGGLAIQGGEHSPPQKGGGEKKKESLSWDLEKEKKLADGKKKPWVGPRGEEKGGKKEKKGKVEFPTGLRTKKKNRKKRLGGHRCSE